MQPDVLYLIEHVARELDIACAIRHLAQERHGVNVEIGSLASESGLAATPRPKLIAVPFFCSKNSRPIRHLIRRFPGVPFANMAFEQMICKGVEKLKCPKNDTARHNVLYLAMGDFFGDYLASYGVDRQNVVNIGSMACQLYRPPYRAYYEGRREEFSDKYGLDAAKTWVFFPENYGAAFFSDRTVASRVRQGCDYDEVVAYRDFARASFDRVMRWCSEAARLGSVELIIRPRPATARDAFIDEFRRVAGEPPRENLHFIKDESVRQWILASQIVVSSYSTSLVEAAVAGKPAYMLVAMPFPRSVWTEWNGLAPHLTSQREFLELLDHPGQAKVSRPLIDWAENRLLGHGDPIAAAADVLASICQGKRPAPPAPPPLPLAATTRDGVRRLGKTIEGLYRQVGPEKKSARSNFYENDHFSADEVENRTNRWAELLEDTVQLAKEHTRHLRSAG